MTDPSKGRLPDFVVIGAPKAATTSLHYYLSIHPEIFMSEPKETRYFDSSHGGNWHRGEEWYRSLFQSTRPRCGEATPAYAVGDEVGPVPQRMAALIPDAKLIYIVREPYRRLESAYLMDYRRDFFRGTFEEYVRSYQRAVRGSQYGSRLREFLEYYPLERILVLETVELGIHTAEVMRRVYSYLGVDADFRSVFFHHRQNTRALEVVPSERGRRFLKSRFMTSMRAWLPKRVYYHFRNLMLLPFRAPQPSLQLPASLRTELKEDFRREVVLLRQLTGLALPSLDQEERVSCEQAATA